MSRPATGAVRAAAGAVVLAVVISSWAAAQSRLPVVSTPDTAAQVERGGAGLIAVHWVEAASVRTHRIMVHNRSAAPLVVAEYTVAACQGIRMSQCETRAAGDTVPAGGTVVVGEVGRSDVVPTGMAYRYEVEVDVDGKRVTLAGLLDESKSGSGLASRP